MLRKLGTFMLVLAVVALASPTFLASVDGAKGSAAEDADHPAAPASSEWGMFIMGLLVMTASTALLLGGHNQGAWRFPLPETRSGGSTSKGSGPPRRSSKSSQRKMRQRLSALRSQQTQQLKRRNLTQRGATHTKPRRRGGPGCRGVR